MRSHHNVKYFIFYKKRVIIINHGKVVTDNRVEELMELFNARQYSITLGETLSEQQLAQLNVCFPSYSYDANQVKPNLVVELLSPDQIYQVFDILKQNGTTVENIDRNLINFEQVFMKIIKGEADYELDSSVSS